jgi:hypothetical protein
MQWDFKGSYISTGIPMGSNTHLHHVGMLDLTAAGFPLPVLIPKKQLGLGFNKTCQHLYFENFPNPFRIQ